MATTSAWHGEGNELTALWEIPFPHSLGLLYSAFTYYARFKVNLGEYKIMGLAPSNFERGSDVGEFVVELWMFMRERKKFWLLPIVIMLVVFGGLVVLTQGSAIAPFIYTLF